MKILPEFLYTMSLTEEKSIMILDHVLAVALGQGPESAVIKALKRDGSKDILDLAGLFDEYISYLRYNDDKGMAHPLPHDSCSLLSAF